MDFNVYKDIEKRTNGEIYIGVVGPVRTGKSTFIKNFMDIAVVPNIKDENEVRRTMDELRARYHFQPEKNWMNDPNGFSYYDD